MKRFLMAVVGLVALPATVLALTVLQLNLEQLTALSEKVFVGRCESVVQERDSAGRPVQVVTYKVADTLKGSPEDRVTFRQLGFVDDSGDVQEIGDTTVMGVVREVPHYKVGEDAVVFLSSEGRLGYTAPVGLFQGKFEVITKDSGRKTVVNGLRNQGLTVGWNKSPRLKSMSLSSGEKSLLNASGGEISYDDFVSLVKKIAQP